MKKHTLFTVLIIVTFSCFLSAQTASRTVSPSKTVIVPVRNSKARVTNKPVHKIEKSTVRLTKTMNPKARVASATGKSEYVKSATKPAYISMNKQTVNAKTINPKARIAVVPHKPEHLKSTNKPAYISRNKQTVNTKTRNNTNKKVEVK